MALSRVKTWNAAETLTASDLNAEFNNICNHFGSLDNDDINSTATYTMGELIVGSGITSADGGQLHVHTATAGTIQASADADEAVFENSGASGVTILSGATSTGNIAFGDSGDADNGLLKYTHGATPTLGITVNATAVQSIAAAATTLAHDLAVYQDANNADSQIALGTSATEALFVDALNGGSNKTLEELRFTTKTASGTANHGKMSWYVDEVNIGNVNDDGITLESGKIFTGNITGNVTGNTSGTAATVTGGTQAAITTCANLTTVGTVTTGTWSGVIDGSATMTVGSDATGDVYFRDASGHLERLGASTDGYVLTTGGAGTIPAWEALPGGGTFSGPGSSTENAIVRFTNTSGNSGDNSGILIDDSNNVTGAGNVTLSGELDAATGDFSGIIDVAGAATLASLVCTAGGTFGGGYGATGATISTAGVGQFNGNVTTDGLLAAATMTLSSTSTISGDMTFVDDAKVTLGTGGDADLYYDGTNLVINPVVAGTGHLQVDSTRQIIAEFTSTTVNPFVAITAASEAVGDGGALGFTVDKGAAIGSASMIGYIQGIITQATGSALKGDLRFFTNSGDSNNERMRIDANGRVNNEANPVTAGNGALGIYNNQNGQMAVTIANTHGSGDPLILDLDFSGRAADNNTGWFIRCQDSSVARMFVYSDGDLANHDGTYGTISDVKFKQDITDVRSYWDDFKSIQYRKFRHKTDVEANADAPYRLGLVAQEVETIFPALVPESPDIDIETQEAVVDDDGEAVLDEDGNPTYETIQTPSGTTYKWVKSSIIEGPIMGSVVQELQTRLEAAEAKITALESA